MTNLSIRPGLPDDHDLLADFLTGLDAESAYQRFLTGFAGAPGRALLAALLPDERSAGALLGFVDGELVAHGLWAALGHERSAELAIVVADRHQRRGIGTALTYALSAELSARRIERVQVLSGSGNRAVARMIARHAPAATRELDGMTLTYSFPTPTTAVRSLPRVTGHDPRRLRRSA
jgi:GNAT superfamily N-acetyltransferase